MRPNLPLYDLSTLFRLNVLHCKNHPDAPLIEDYHAGDMICSLCGLVVGDRVIDVGSEWRTFSNDKNSKDMSRVGSAEVSITLTVRPSAQSADVTIINMW